MNIQQLRERYAAPEIPKCRVCGGELTVQRAGGGPTIWGCTGMVDDPTGERNWIYAEGRSCADEHYERSRWSDYRQGGDADVIELIERLEAAERERDELKQRLANAEHQLHMAELAKFNLRNQRKAQFRKRREAEAEIVRRDAAAGDSRKIFTCSGCGAEGLDEPLESRCHCCIAGAHWVEGKLYTAAQPAVLPPDITFESKGFVSLTSEDFAYNRALEDARKLGAQQQKVVELPEPHAHLIWIQAGRGPDDYWDDVEISRCPQDRCCDGSDRYAVYSEFEVKDMLDAAGVKWEVKS